MHKKLDPPVPYGVFVKFVDVESDSFCSSMTRLSRRGTLDSNLVALPAACIHPGLAEHSVNRSIYYHSSAVTRNLFYSEAPG